MSADCPSVVPERELPLRRDRIHEADDVYRVDGGGITAIDAEERLAGGADPMREPDLGHGDGQREYRRPVLGQALGRTSLQTAHSELICERATVPPTVR